MDRARVFAITIVSIYARECSMSSYDLLILLIRNLLDTPLHVYKPLHVHR